MIAYKANALRWTQDGFQTTDKTVIGKLWRNPHGPWTIAYQIENGTGGLKQSMVDKTTVKKIEAKKVTDDKHYWYEETKI